MSQAQGQIRRIAKEGDKLVQAVKGRLREQNDVVSIMGLDTYNKKLQSGLEATAKALGTGLAGKSLNAKSMPKVGTARVPAVKVPSVNEAGAQIASASDGSAASKSAVSLALASSKSSTEGGATPQAIGGKGSDSPGKTDAPKGSRGSTSVPAMKPTCGQPNTYGQVTCNCGGDYACTVDGGPCIDHEFYSSHIRINSERVADYKKEVADEQANCYGAGDPDFCPRIIARSQCSVDCYQKALEADQKLLKECEKPQVNCTPAVKASFNPAVTAVNGKAITFTATVPKGCDSAQISWNFQGTAGMGKNTPMSGASTKFTPGATPGTGTMIAAAGKGKSAPVAITVVQVKVTAPKPAAISYGGADSSYFCTSTLPKGADQYFDPQVLPAGALALSVVAPAKHCGTNQTEVIIKSSPKAPCQPKATVSAILTTTKDTLAKVPVTVMLPTKDVAVFSKNHTCHEGHATGLGGIVEWTITFSGSGNANFDGLTVDESLQVVNNGPADPASCDLPKRTPKSGPIGRDGHNKATDTLASCDETNFLNCQSAFLQKVSIGACPVQTNKIFYVFKGGNFFTKRADPSTGQVQSSPPIAQ